MLPFLVFILSVGLSHQADLHYYIAAVELDWDYAPSGRNEIKGEDFSPDRYNKLLSL